MAVPLSTLLEDARCQVRPAELQRGIIAVFGQYCHGITIEEVVIDPCGKAIPFCNRVRQHVRDYSVPDRIILLTAMNLRKQAKLPLLAASTSQPPS